VRPVALAVALALGTPAARSAEPFGAGPPAGVFAHDPTLAVQGDTAWVFFTGKGIQALRSSDRGATWTPAPPVVRSLPDWWTDAVPEHFTSDVWAPDVSVYRGRFRLLYAISTFGSNASAIGALSAETPDGPWRDDGLVIRSTPADDFNAIDPELFVDADGAPWLAFGSFWSGIQLVPLDAATLRPAGPRRVLAARAEGVEAPALLRHGGDYFLFVSVGRCCQGVQSTYRIVVGRAKAVTGPYLDRGGKDLHAGGGEVLVIDPTRRGSSGGERWKGPGGQDVVDGLLVFHAYDATDGGKAKLRIAPIVWGPDGWPALAPEPAAKAP
jgi:arabinan endo-1,5-alpha-L-arabinosidase